MAIYLGNQIISSNPTGTGALYLGEQNICTAYLGAVKIFDNCAVANTNVRLNIQDPIKEMLQDKLQKTLRMDILYRDSLVLLGLLHCQLLHILELDIFVLEVALM